MLRIESMEKRGYPPLEAFFADCIYEIEETLQMISKAGEFRLITNRMVSKTVDIDVLVRRLCEQVSENGKSNTYRFTVTDCEQLTGVIFSIAFESQVFEQLVVGKIWFSESTVIDAMLLDEICNRFHQNCWVDINREDIG